MGRGRKNTTRKMKQRAGQLKKKLRVIRRKQEAAAKKA
jgi:hypothetical protein